MAPSAPVTTTSPCWFLPSLPTLLLLQLFCFSRLVDASCYYPDGTLSPNDLPCSDTTTNSACCGQGYACLSNGICEATGDELQKPGASQFVRGSCTDKNWRSSNCPLFCIDPNEDNTGGGEGIFKCDNTPQDLYFCINQFNVETLNGTNCDTLQNVLFFPGTPSAITTIGVTPTMASSMSKTSITSMTSSLHSSPTATPTHSSTQESSASSASSASSTSSTSSTSTSTSSDASGATFPASTPLAQSTKDGTGSSSSSNHAAVIGGAVGGSLAGIAVIALLVWLVLRRRRKGPAETTKEAPSYEVGQQPPPPFSQKSDLVQYNQVVHEAPDWETINQHSRPEIYEVA